VRVNDGRRFLKLLVTQVVRGREVAELKLVLSGTVAEEEVALCAEYGVRYYVFRELF